MTPTQLTSYLQFAITNDFNVLVKGKPGIGKTDIVKQAAQLAGAELIISHPVVSDPTDYKGLPFADKNGEAHFLPFGDLRKLINATTLTAFFIDDIGQAVPTVQAALMQLIWGGRINGHEVNSKYVRFIGATNRAEDKAAVHSVIEPVKSRFASIVELEVTTDDWVIWAMANNMPIELIAFIRFRPELLDNFTPTKDIVNSPSPRTVANVGKQQAAGLPSALEFEVFKGAAGEAFASEYTAFLEMFRNLPNIDQIILNPTGADVPTQAGILYALSGALAHKMNDNNIDAIVTYLDRLPGEIAVCCVKDAITKKPALTNTRGYIKFATGKAGNMVL